MAFGSYRLSSDEQRQLAAQTSHAARRQRILTVRRQARRFAQTQREKYKSLLEAEESLQRRQRIAAWEKERDRQLAALSRRYGREIEAIGGAQREAEEATAVERTAQKRNQIQERLQDVRRQTRFREALRVVREMDVGKRQRLRRIVDQRLVETQRSRQNAQSYDQRRLVQAAKGASTGDLDERRARARWRDAAIDFRFSRVHQQLGVAQTATRHSPEACENAMIAAEKERKKSLALDHRLCKVRAVAEDKARDRGEVALLRERAIVQRQMHEAYLEQLRRADIDRQQKAVISKRVPLRHRVQNEANRPEATEAVEQILADLENKKAAAKEASVHRRRQEAVPSPVKAVSRNVSRVDASVQVNTEMSDGGESAPVSDSLSIARKSVPIQKRSTPTPQLNKAPAKETPTAASAATGHAPHTPKQKPENLKEANQLNKRVTEKAKPPSLAEGRGEKRPSVDHRSHNTHLDCAKRKTAVNKPTQNRGPNVRAKKQPQSGTENPLLRQLPESGIMESCEEAKEGYEDALSEALSMDTDLFMLYFFENAPAESSATSDNARLDDLSALLASDSDAASSLDLSQIRQSDLETASTQRDHRSQSFSLSETDSPFISETASDAETPEFGTRSVHTGEDIETLFKGLEQISGDSLSLLSSLSTILASQNTSEPTLSATSCRTLSDSPSPDGSLLLDTILEESNASFCTSISDLALTSTHESGRREPCFLEIASESSTEYTQ